MKFILQVMVTSPKLGHLINVYGFTSTSLSPIKTKLSRMLDQHTLILPCMVASQLVHMTKACGFIYTSF